MDVQKLIAAAKRFREANRNLYQMTQFDNDCPCCEEDRREEVANAQEALIAAALENA